MRKHRRAVQKLAREFEREVVIQKNGHLSLLCKRGERPPVITSASPSDHRTLKNLKMHLRHNDEV